MSTRTRAQEFPMADVWISVQAIGGVGSEVEISAQEAKHALGARRLGTGDSVTFFDGFGTTASAEIIDGRSRGGERFARVESVRLTPRVQRTLTIACALPKGDRLATLLDMATQAGVDRFIPIDCERSVVDEEKLARNDRWQRILIEACKQSRRAWLPELVAGGSIAEVMQREAIRQAASFIAHLAPTSRPLDVALRESASHASAIVWIGPEGGFTDAEVSLLQASGGNVVTLGAHVLRIETAAVAAAAVFAQSRLAVNEG